STFATSSVVGNGVSIMVFAITIQIYLRLLRVVVMASHPRPFFWRRQGRRKHLLYMAVRGFCRVFPGLTGRVRVRLDRVVFMMVMRPRVRFVGEHFFPGLHPEPIPLPHAHVRGARPGGL